MLEELSKCIRRGNLGSLILSNGYPNAQKPVAFISRPTKYPLSFATYIIGNYIFKSRPIENFTSFLEVCYHVQKNLSKGLLKFKVGNMPVTKVKLFVS